MRTLYSVSHCPVLYSLAPVARGAVALLAAMGAMAALGSAQAAVVTIVSPFVNLENRGLNSLGFSSGQFMRIGANSVTPNGDDGTTGVGTHVLDDGSTLTRTIGFAPAPVIPNFFQRLLTDSPALRGAWTLSFSNGGDTTSANVYLDPAVQQMGFVSSITLSGSTANPTFTWTPPAGGTVHKYRINIYDRSLISVNNSGVVMSRDLLPVSGQTSYTVNAADFTLPDYAFTLGTRYAIEISAIETKDGTSNSNNANVAAIARTYADFTPNLGDGPPVNLPVVLVDGSYQFNMSVVPGVTYYIDPDVAVGYDYATGAGDPLFTSVDLPDAIGDGLYDLWTFDNAGLATLVAQNWLGTQVFDFGPVGVSRFRVTGIEVGANLDPADTTAFVTGLTFSAAGQFTGTQTPITVSVGGSVPEPGALLLALSALGAAGLFSRRQRLAR